jgi:hypothetical protein
MLVRDSGGIAHVLSEIIEPLLPGASELPRETFVHETRSTRWKAVENRIKRLCADKHHDINHALAHEMRDDLYTVCMHLENLTTFSFATNLKRAADMKPVRQPFDQAVLDVIVQACTPLLHL